MVRKVTAFTARLDLNDVDWVSFSEFMEAIEDCIKSVPLEKRHEIQVEFTNGDDWNEARLQFDIKRDETEKETNERLQHEASQREVAANRKEQEERMLLGILKAKYEPTKP